MWIVAGPNGAGKSTFTNEFINENIRPPGLIQLNADEVTAGYRYHDKTISQDELNLRAARLIGNGSLVWQISAERVPRAATRVTCQPHLHFAFSAKIFTGTHG
jgi:predicted ABC-type ATPase